MTAAAQRLFLVLICTIAVQTYSSRAPNWYLSDKTCPGDDTYSRSKGEQWKFLKHNYENCTTIVGSLYLTNLQKSESDLSFLKQV